MRGVKLNDEESKTGREKRKEVEDIRLTFGEKE